MPNTYEQRQKIRQDLMSGGRTVVVLNSDTSDELIIIDKAGEGQKDSAGRVTVNHQADGHKKYASADAKTAYGV